MSRAPLARRFKETWSTLEVAWRTTAGRRELWPGMHEPFNGQRLRLRTVRTLVTHFDPDAFIETGTFIGSTTRFFCGNGVPVYTAEVKRTFWLVARLKLGWVNDVTVFRRDSRATLGLLAQRGTCRRPFVYLDAHWWGGFPLDDELKLIFEAWSDVIVVIDDFRVEDDEGYGYDSYKDVALALDEITIPSEVVAAFPKDPSTQETGARRGTLYLAKGSDGHRVFDRAVTEGFLRFV